MMETGIGRDEELMSIVSYLYYYADMNQSDIAERLFLSRSTVSRLIKKARQSGVVELKIREPWRRDFDMEGTIKNRFGIDRVRVLSSRSPSPEAVLDELCKMAGYYVSCIAGDKQILGMSWGNTIAHVVSSIGSNKNIPITVVPIMGSMTWPQSAPESVELSYRFSRMFGARYLHLDSPLYASSPEQLRALQESPGNREALECARRADFIMTSVGSIKSGSWEKVLGAEKLVRLQEIGCVGHIGGHYFDINGCEIEGNYKELLVGLTLDEIRRSRNVICVADTSQKGEAVYGALRGGIVNTLMITLPLAARLLEIDNSRRI